MCHVSFSYPMSTKDELMPSDAHHLRATAKYAGHFYHYLLILQETQLRRKDQT